jgi:hypothetical protein
MPKNRSMKKRVSKRANRKIRGNSRKSKSMRNKKRMLGGLIGDTGYCTFKEYLKGKGFNDSEIENMEKNPAVYKEYETEYNTKNVVPTGCVNNNYIQSAYLRVDGNHYNN